MADTLRRAFASLCLWLSLHATAADVVVHANREADTLAIEATAEFEGTLALAWQVVTDSASMCWRHGRIGCGRYSGRMVPDFFVPPLIGTWMLRVHVHETFAALVDEIVRRQRAGRAGEPEAAQ